jgi:sugar/nucleoside kinase (ribokinase family)
MNTYDIVTIGDVKLDTFVVLPEAHIQCQLKMPECLLCLDYGKKIAVDVVDSQIAGSATNVAVGFRRMGQKTAVVSVMGKDSTRQLALEILKKEGVDSRLIKIHTDAKSGFAVVLNYKGEKTILTSFVPCQLHLPPTLNTEWLYLSELGVEYELLFQEILNWKKRHPKALLAFNPGVVQIRDRSRRFFQLLKQTAVLFTNLDEAQDITKSSGHEIHQLLHALHRLCPRIVVVTNGHEGAYAFNGKDAWYCPIFPGELVEATGAGDAFATGFLEATIKGKTIEIALAWGAVNASSVVGFIGPQKGLLSTRKIQQRLRTHKDFRAIKI